MSITDREALRRVIEETDTPTGRVFAWIVQGLILFSVLEFSIETLPNLSPRVMHTFHIIDYVTLFFFTAEYLLRIYVAKSKWRYIFSFYGLVDLLAILPFYLAHGLDLRTVRMLRFLRVLRLLKLTRYNRAARRLKNAFYLVHEELTLFACTTLILLYLSSVAIYYFEHEAQPEAFSSVFASMWWSVATLTTVGYGDVYPVTIGGRMFTGVMLLIGIGVISVPAGLIASAFSRAREMEAEMRDQTLTLFDQDDKHDDNDDECAPSRKCA